MLNRGLVVICLACVPLLSGCATDGVRNVSAVIAEKDSDCAEFIATKVAAKDNAKKIAEASRAAGQPVPATPNTVDVKGARACLKAQVASYSNTGLGYIDETTGWRNGFVTVASSAVGVTISGIFGPASVALKAIGLGAGALSQFESIRDPVRMGTLYNHAADTLACMYDASMEMRADSDTSGQIKNQEDRMDADLIKAQDFVNRTDPNTDKNLPILNAVIVGAKAARVVADQALTISDAPDEFLLDQADNVRLAVTDRLNATSVDNIATLQKALQDSVNAATALKAANAGKDAPLPSGGKSVVNDKGDVQFDAFDRAKPADAITFSQLLQEDTRQLLNLSQGLADTKASIPVCMTKMPT